MRYVPDWYKTQGMYDKVVVENGRILKVVLDSCKNQKNCQTVDNYTDVLKWFKIQKMCDEVVDTYPFAI